MDRDFLEKYLEESLAALESGDRDDVSTVRDRQPQLVEILTSLLGKGYAELYLRASMTGNVGSMIRVIGQALTRLDEGGRVAAALGPPPGPSLRGDALHATVWDACASLWRSKHYRQAVNAAATAVNAALQARLNRRDCAESDLVTAAFTLDDPKPGQPRLRLRQDDGSPTYRSMQNGAREFGCGCFRAIRNPGAHEVDDEPPEHEALEQLASFSILARWIEAAELVTAEE